MIDKLIYLLLAQNSQTSSDIETQTLPFTFKSNGRPLKNYRIYGNTVNDESVGDLVTEGEHAGEYCVPVTISNGSNTQTTNIYLTQQIRKVGEKTDYVDYKNQKQYKVSENLFNYSTQAGTEWGYLFNNGQRGLNDTWRITDYIPCNGTEFTISPIGGNDPSICLYDENKNFICGKSYHTGGAHIKTSVTITSIQNAAYIRFSYNTGGTITQIDNIYYIMLNAGSESLAYEPYIEETELGIALPALPTFSGINILSVGTTVQPSKIYLQGNISEIETVSAQSLQASPRTLDVMPIDRDEFQINDISEMSVEEIPETDNLETTGDEENAE